MSEKVLSPASFRITEETKELFREKSKEFGMNQDETLRKLISIHELEEAKLQLPGRQTEIETFDSHLHALSEVYRMSLQLNQDAEERIRGAYDTTLDSNQKLIIKLQGENEVLQDGLGTSQETVNQLTEQYDEIAEKYKELKRTTKTIEELCEEYKEKLERYEVDREKQAELEQKLEQALEQANQLPKLKEQIEEQERQHKKEIEILKQQAELEKQLAVSETNREANEKHRDLLEQLDELRKENYRLEKSLLQKPTSSRTKKKVEEKQE